MATAPGPPTCGAALGLLGAITSGLLVGGLVLLAERGLESRWTTGPSVDGAFADGAVRRISQGDVQVSGEVLDDVANFRGSMLHIEVLHADGSLENRDIYNRLGNGRVEAIEVSQPTGRGGLVVAGDARSIRVQACSGKSEKEQQQVIDKSCGAWREIWRR